MFNNIFTRLPWHPSWGTLAAGFLVILGFLLSEINWGYLSLAALGTFGPGILREFGFLNDHDEFQRRAARQAGYHAFLTAGLFTFLLLAYIRSGNRNLGEPEALVTLILALLWFTWFLSSLLSYWGPRRTVSRILAIFGTVWLIFNILGNMNDPMAMSMQSLITIPFFLMAYIAKYWPKIAGGLLILAASFFFYFFHLYEIFGPEPLKNGRGFVLIMFAGPLFMSGVILLRSKVNQEENQGG